MCYVVVLYMQRRKVTGNSSLQEKKKQRVLGAAQTLNVYQLSGQFTACTSLCSNSCLTQKYISLTNSSS